MLAVALHQRLLQLSWVPAQRNKARRVLHTHQQRPAGVTLLVVWGLALRLAPARAGLGCSSSSESSQLSALREATAIEASVEASHLNLGAAREVQQQGSHAHPSGSARFLWAADAALWLLFGGIAAAVTVDDVDRWVRRQKYLRTEALVLQRLLCGMRGQPARGSKMPRV